MRRPKFSIGSWAFSFGPFEKDPWSFEKFLKYAAKTGYDGIEINGFLPHPHPESYNTKLKCIELRKSIEHYNLGISGYAPDFRHVPPAELASEAYIEALEKMLRFCNWMEIDVLRVDTISPPDALSADEYSSRFGRLAHTWSQAAEVCAKAGIKLVWEFEPGFWLNKPSEVVSIVHAVNHNNFKVLFDTSHAHMCAVVGARQNGDVETLKDGVSEFASMLKNHIGHFHLIDSDGTLHGNETSTHAPFGTGNIDFVSAISAMRDEVESLDWWCFDFCFCPTTERDAKKAIPFVEKIISKIS